MGSFGVNNGNDEFRGIGFHGYSVYYTQHIEAHYFLRREWMAILSEMGGIGV